MTNQRAEIVKPGDIIMLLMVSHYEYNGSFYCPQSHNKSLDIAKKKKECEEA